MDFPLGQSLVMGFWLGQSLVVALSYYFGRRFGESFLFWVDHEGRPYVIRSILVDGWGCHYGIRFNQCGNVNHSFSTICTVSFNIIIPFSICPNIHTLLWHGYEIQSRLCIIISFQTNTAAVMFGWVIAYVLVFVVAHLVLVPQGFLSLYFSTHLYIAGAEGRLSFFTLSRAVTT